MYARNFSGNGSKWISGKVVAMTGPVSMVIILSDGQQVRRHILIMYVLVVVKKWYLLHLRMRCSQEGT